MTPLEDARRLKPRWYWGGGQSAGFVERCDDCHGAKPRHRKGCPWLSLPKIIKILESVIASELTRSA